MHSNAHCCSLAMEHPMQMMCATSFSKYFHAKSNEFQVIFYFNFLVVIFWTYSIHTTLTCTQRRMNQMWHVIRLREWWKWLRISQEPGKFKGIISIEHENITRNLNFRNPSVQGDTPFKSSTSPNELFSQEIDNNPKTSVLTDITKQHHYDTWRDVEKIIQQGVQNNGSRLEAIFPGGTFSEGIFEKNGNWLAKKFNCC